MTPRLGVVVRAEDGDVVYAARVTWYPHLVATQARRAQFDRPGAVTE